MDVQGFGQDAAVTTLDSPSRTGDLSDMPLVAEESFPNEIATGSADSLDQERRLFSLAMTHACDELHLIEPLRYHVMQLSRGGAWAGGRSPSRRRRAVARALVRRSRIWRPVPGLVRCRESLHGWPA